MKRNSATTRSLGEQEQEEVRDAVAGDPSDAGAGLQLLQCSVPATLGHLRMLVRGAPVPKEEHQRNTERDKNYKTRTCMFYAEAFFYCPLKAFMKIHEIIHYEMK